MVVSALCLFICFAAVTGFSGIENRNVKNSNLFEGDMLLTPSQRYAAMVGGDVSKAEMGRASVFKNLWPGAVLPYVIDNELKRSSRAMNAIRESMKIWETKTCVRFKQRTTERNYAYFHKGAGCTSYVGVQGGRQMISLASGCWHTYITVHEIGHCLGFYHEQSRPDRDNYVNIYWNNIYPQYKFAFNKYPRSTIDSLGTPYDYKSIMHYEAYDFSKNRRVTIAAKKSGIVLSNRVGPTDIDIKQMNLMYKCSGGGGGGGGGGG
ncbi:zinc metalloproteinase nas-4, partial [Exaiptasia diaphana]|uniref:Metalloendopeptidase n=1 Tax=Exaiptasia diaphana TaxID=2652724 RepID=A0A913XA77_EXADI